jgi:predicted aspartyl protease
MPLVFHDGQKFATGSVPYSYRPETERQDIPKLFLQVQIEGQYIEALVDTGAQFFICPPDVAKLLKLQEMNSSTTEALRIRGVRIEGTLHRVTLTLLAEEGESLSVEVTAFVPKTSEEYKLEGPIPSFLGLFCCLERLRFAVDPSTETFYFGSIS